MKLLDHVHRVRVCRVGSLAKYLIIFILLIAQASVALAQAPAPSPPASISPVIIHGGQTFIKVSSWEPFEIRGVNYVRPSNTDSQQCPDLDFGAHSTCPWNSQQIASDMQRLQGLGVNTVRVFLNFYAFGGARMNYPHYSPEPALNHLADFISIANQHNIYVMPVLLAKYPQHSHFNAEDLAFALDNHVRPIVERFANHPGILAWDLFNEPDIASPVDIRCWDWDNRAFVLCYGIAQKRMLFLNMLRDEVKRMDLYKPLTISVAFAKSYFRPEGAYSVPLAMLVDFYSFHYYDNDPYDSGRYAQHWYYGDGFPSDLERSIDELVALNLNKPIVVSELGFPSGNGALRQLDKVQHDLRIARQITQHKGISGMILWPFQAQPEEYVTDLFR